MATAKERRQAREAAAAKHQEDFGDRNAAYDEMRSDAIDKTNQAAIKNPGATTNAHGEQMKPSRAGAKVTVACKLGIAYFDLQVTRLKEKWENTQTGPRKIMEAVRVGAVVRIRGTAYPRGTPPVGFPPPPTIVDGAALNPDIDAEFWEAWAEVNRLNPLVVNKMIFAHEQHDFVVGQARELKGIVSGLEPMNPNGDPRAPQSTRADMEKIQTEEGRAKTMRQQ